MIMTNLFSIFDPSLSLFSFSWVLRVLLIFLFPYLYYSTRGLVSSSLLTSLVSLNSEVGYVIHSPRKGVYLFLTSIFLCILVLNFLAIFPYIFSLTSHLFTTLPFSFTFWFSIIFFTWFNFIKHFLSHLIPVGTPLGLIRFIVLVELLRNLIRPIALTFRLTANIIAGHLLMSLIAGALISLPFSFILLGSLAQFLLIFIEVGVSFIQSYVFMSLLLLYMSEGVVESH